MSGIIRCLAVVTVLLAGGGEAASAYRLADPLAMERPSGYCPVSGGHAGRTTVARDPSGVVRYGFARAAVGGIDAPTGETRVGCAVAPPDGVDWVAFSTNVADQAAAREGYVFYVASTNAAERLVVARPGDFRVDWPLADGGTRTVWYDSQLPASVVPHRLFWTSAPFNGPGVSLPSNYGIRLFGDTNLFWQTSSTNSLGAPVCDYGVRYDADAHTCLAYARQTADGTAVGPRGTFVVAYYDSGDCVRYVGCTVVEVTGPDVVYLRARVGDEVRPLNENYDPDSASYAKVIENDGVNGGDPRAPYFFEQTYQSASPHRKEKRVFAIAETEPGETGAKRAEIYWEAADDFNVQWPFEQTCYHITWPDCPTVVIGTSGTSGTPGVTLPDGYSPSLLAWRQPLDVATVNGTSLVLRKPGRFTLKLTNAAADDFALVPLVVAASDDASVFDLATPRPWTVGREIVSEREPTGGGFVYAPNSPGRNWNPDFGTNAVCLVNTSDAADWDVEVWWSRSYTPPGLDAALSFPCDVERFKAVWPVGHEVPDIVFASERGSAAGGFRAAGTALRLTSAEAVGSFSCPLGAAAESAVTVGFWFNPGPRVGVRKPTPTSTGAVCRVATGAADLALSVERAATATEAAQCRLAGGGTSLALTVAPDAWTHFAFVVRTNAVVICRDGVPLATNDLPAAAVPESVAFAVGGAAAAVGAVLDDFRVWGQAADPDALAAFPTNGLAGFGEAVVSVGFEDIVRGTDGTLAATDAVSHKFFVASGAEPAVPGGPVWEEGWLDASGDVEPTVYARAASAALGAKPNVEHAFTLGESNGRYSVYALRTDLNDADHPPFALVSLEESGRPAMRLYRVDMTNAWYRWPSLSYTVGDQLTPPHPLDAFDGAASVAVAMSAGEDASIFYRDRTGTDWIRRDGTARLYPRYTGLAGFACTRGPADERDLAGAAIPFMDLADAYDWASPPAAAAGVERDRLLAGTPTPLEVTATWPKTPMRVMSVGQSLAKAEGGLPDVYDMKTCAVLYPRVAKGAPRAVKLIDPTCRREVGLTVRTSFPDEYGFTLGKNGNCVSSNGRYTFVGLPASIGDRLFVDTATTNGTRLVLSGDYHDAAAGVSYLRVNSLSSVDADAVKAFFKGVQAKTTDPAKKANLTSLVTAVDTLAALDDVEPTEQTSWTYDPKNALLDVTNRYFAAEHYALVATGEGTGWVTLVENDGPAAGSLPVSVHTLFVTNTLYCGQLVTLTDPNNALSEQVSALYTAPLGRTADNFKFVWWHCDEPSNGRAPTVPDGPSETPADDGWVCDEGRSGKGASCINTVANANTGSVSMKDLVNRYWTMHYQAKEKGVVANVGTNWSAWCQPTLAEGWLQRVLNAVTPFAQRAADLSSNKAELKYTMLGQIGAPWQGDVALNNETLASVGLEEFYRTVLNRAEAMSIAAGTVDTNLTNVAVNRQLAECVARLADMEMTLGAEAYSDAQNPLVSMPDGEQATGAVFCFANQVPTLLDEELALLRGRTSAVAPALTDYPCYNRLMWNFTKGVTQGEVAYVNNYNISASGGVLDANAAAAMYPQGHGDAYGYYLSAVKNYYRLLRNPNFDWGEPSMMSMLVAGHVVNADYQEEDKFAEAAYDLAKIGQQVVSLTARKQWKDGAADARSAYFDANEEQAFGYGEWGCRAGYGAFVNWAVANTLLPLVTNAATSFADLSIADVTRRRSESLEPLGASVGRIENVLNAVDAGLNPLGLSENLVPFDLSAAEMQGSATGQDAKGLYEQMRERTVTALGNAGAALAYAGKFGSRLRAIENAEVDANAAAEEMEAAYEKQLIAIYGRPYADDIGPGKTYDQGYSGPDLYHYMYVDLDRYSLAQIGSYTNTVEVEVATAIDYTNANGVAYVDFANDATNGSLKVLTQVTETLTYTTSSGGIVLKPESFVGTRASEGLMQQAYHELISAYLGVMSASNAYMTAYQAYAQQLATSKSELLASGTVEAKTLESLSTQTGLTIAMSAIGLASKVIDFAVSFFDKKLSDNLKKASTKSFSELDKDAKLASAKTIIDISGGEEVSDALKKKVYNATVRTQLRKLYMDKNPDATEEATQSFNQSLATYCLFFNFQDQNVVERFVNEKNLAGDAQTASQIRSAAESHVSKIVKAKALRTKAYFYNPFTGSTSLTGTGAEIMSQMKAISDEWKSVVRIGDGEILSQDAILEKQKTRVKAFIALENLIAKGKVSREESWADQPTDVILECISLVEVRFENPITEATVDAYINESCTKYGKNLLTGMMLQTWHPDVVLGSLWRKSTDFKLALKWSKFIADVSKSALTLVQKLMSYKQQRLDAEDERFQSRVSAYDTLVASGEDLLQAAHDLEAAHAALLESARTYEAVIEAGEMLQEERTRERTRLANQATSYRYQDMYARVARNAALSKYATAFDVAQRHVYQLTRAYDYETGLGKTGVAASGTFADAAVATRALGEETLVSDGSSVTDPGLWDVVNRMDANFAKLKGRLGLNNPDKTVNWFSLRWSLFRLPAGGAGDEAWRKELERSWRDDVFADPDVARLCQRPAGSETAEPGFVISFTSAIWLDRNFFDRPLLSGDAAYSSSDCTVKIFETGVDFTGYDALVAENGIAAEPNVYLVPAGVDSLRAPGTSGRVVRTFDVVEQTLPLPYAVGEADVAAKDWVAAVGGSAAASASVTDIRRHSTMRACAGFSSTRLVGRSVWNGRWVLVIPARSMHMNPLTAKKVFVNGLSGRGGVSDIKLGIRAYSRSGN